MEGGGHNFYPIMKWAVFKFLIGKNGHENIVQVAP